MTQENRSAVKVARVARYTLLFAVCYLFARLVFPASGPKPGARAKAFELRSVDSAHDKLSLQDCEGKLVFMEVFASWCQGCRTMAPVLADVALAQRKLDVVFVGVSLDESAQSARQAQREWGIPYEVAHGDPDFVRAYRVQALPTFILIGRDGHVRDVVVGVTSRDRLEHGLAEAGAERL
ncbi:MAG TPA: TlpA disulfide reductase family protein [Candidatus Krumholzibacteria bacterium]